ncbi:MULTISPECIES: Hsp20 family protein [unclassified Mesorhizobium]|uniref:Hsp20 family protein n=1 Tax=unclassified Mesorhizobium TaxID=325217 RepID=UPI0003CE0CC4|nr:MULTISPECIES: Hsp20 family protein [unclassified Mesorhizobium]ESY10824.1 molecular chaperone Hsp20 [Mesorhizobium sp. LNJC395A00]ESZ32093.1 molecular chaperone Hsp20 [Mesorhizobium sp. L2C067A000]ESZ75904.1 molecular chaperone Hsp20 [Mesorhizobium sp. L103C105A0]WJI78063.1 Hsp20 family protein [Mesorhizobium sp. C395A]
MKTNLDFTPLYRSSIGFDRMVDMLESASRVASFDNWPPYDIAKVDDDQYRITMAVAGFSQDQLTVTHQPNMLVVSGSQSGDENGRYLYRGINGRAFERRFELADHVKVEGASLENGLLSIDLKREVPEEMKPRKIEISSGAPMPKIEAPKVETDKLAA